MPMRFLKKYDASGDGKLSQDEAISMAKSEFGVSKNETFKEFVLADQVSCFTLFWQFH